VPSLLPAVRQLEGPIQRLIRSRILGPVLKAEGKAIRAEREVVKKVILPRATSPAQRGRTGRKFTKKAERLRLLRKRSEMPGPVEGRKVRKSFFKKRKDPFKESNFFHPSPEVGKARMALTSQQWKKLVERTILREVKTPNPLNRQGVYEGVLPASAKDEAFAFMSKEAPIAEKHVTRIEIPQHRGGEMIGDRIKEVPYEESFAELARIRAAHPELEEPMLYGLGRRKIRTPKYPDVTSLSVGARGRSGDIGHGASYEKKIFHDIRRETGEAMDTAEYVKKDLEREAKRKAKRESVRAKRKRKKAEAAVMGEVEGTQSKTIQELDIGRMVEQDRILAHMWKHYVRGRDRIHSSAPKVWQNLRDKSPGIAKGKGKTKITTRQFFKRVGMMWMADPELAKRTYGKVATGFIEDMWVRWLDDIGKVGG